MIISIVYYIKVFCSLRKKAASFSKIDKSILLDIGINL